MVSLSQLHPTSLDMDCNNFLAGRSLRRQQSLRNNYILGSAVSEPAASWLCKSAQGVVNVEVGAVWLQAESVLHKAARVVGLASDSAAAAGDAAADKAEDGAAAAGTALTILSGARTEKLNQLELIRRRPAGCNVIWHLRH